MAFLLTDAGLIFFNSQKFFQITLKIALRVFYNENERFRKHRRCLAAAVLGWEQSFARRWAAPAAGRARRAPTHPALGRSGSARLLLFAVSFLKALWAGAITVLVCTSCPLLGKQRLQPARKKILLLCSGRRRGRAMGGGSRTRPVPDLVPRWHLSSATSVLCPTMPVYSDPVYSAQVLGALPRMLQVRQINPSGTNDPLPCPKDYLS